VLPERINASLTGVFQTRELLERRIEQHPALHEEQRQRLREGIDAPDVGYELLKRMSFDDRIRTALPFLRDIVTASVTRTAAPVSPRHQAGQHLRHP
jgi:hypothetical protein